MSQMPPRVPPPVPPTHPMQAVQLGYAPPPARTDLRTIATRQKVLVYCILAYMLCLALQFVLPREFVPPLRLVTLAVIVTATVFVFMLSIALYNTGLGVLLGILTLIPLIGLIVLLIVNGKATGVLRQHGIHVGMMGADSNQIPGPGQIPLP